MDHTRFTNRLAREKSPYLRQHMHNPVDWLPWGEEAFAKARAGQKPIFLSIGYSTCHWCHVMAHESFENPAVAGVLNAHFVPVKMDREERPDVDRVYMTYVQATTGHGGWPMSVWLTPDLKPFYGGTYFPPEDRQGRAGFLAILNALAKAWTHEREKLLAESNRVVEALRQHAESPLRQSDAGRGGRAADELHEAAGEAFQRCFQHFYESFDPTWGGFGSAPKFPRAASLNFLFRVAARQGVQSEVGAEAVKMAAFTLQKMAEGGMHDHVGGGFHRYSVDEEWFVPHFEKMLYDQAQLAMSYLEARQATGREVYAWIARGIFDYVARDLTSPAGAFYSAEDADSLLRAGADEHAEGAFYVWTKEEIDHALGGGAAFFSAHYGVKEGGNVPEHRDPQGEFRGKNVLRQRQSLTVTAREGKLGVLEANEQLLRDLERLRETRAERPRPHLDDKILTAWNGLMISALAKAHQILPCHPERSEESSRARDASWILRSAQNDTPVGMGAAYLPAAARAAEFIRRELYDEKSGVLHRSYREGRSSIEGFAEDYAFLIQGLLDLYEASFEIRWLQWTERLQAKMDDLFWDAERGGYFNSRAGDASIIVRMKEDYDGAEPAPCSVAALNLLRLTHMLGEEDGGKLKRRERALRTIAALRAQWAGAPQALPQMLCALALALEPPRTVVLAGDPQAKDFRALAAVVHERLGPPRALLAADGGEGQRWLAERRPYLADMKPLGGRATAYICENFACQRPVTDAEDLRRLLG